MFSLSHWYMVRLSRCGVVADFPTAVEVAVAMPGDAERPTDTPTCVIFDTGQFWPFSAACLL